MEIDAGARKPDGRDPAEQERERHAAVPPRGVSSRIVLGGLAGLLLLAAASFYFTDRRTGTDVATRPGTGTPSESSAATAARPGERAEPSRSATSTQPATPQQSAIPASPPPPAAIRETPAPPPTTTARDSARSPPQAGERPAVPAAAPGLDPAAAAQAPADPQSPMRDQPTALPDQAAAAPKNEIILVVKRPANIRSAPGQAGRVIGTAAKDAQVKEIGRSPSGNWVQVETATGSGWMSAKLLGPLAPQGR